MATVGRGADQYTVRFPDGLRDRIKAAAEANNRSMNAEIVATLDRYYPAPRTKFDELLMGLLMLPPEDRAGYIEFAEDHLNGPEFSDLSQTQRDEMLSGLKEAFRLLRGSFRG